MSDYAPNLGKVIEHYVRPRRAIHTVFVHCSASSNPAVDAEMVHRWHRDRGWSAIGYHYFMTSGGVLQQGRSPEYSPAAQSGHNSGTLAICLNGLEPEDFNPAMLSKLKAFLDEVNAAHGGRMRFRGHREVANKLCPVFDYKVVLGLDAGGYMTAEPSEVVTEPVPTGRIVIERATVSASKNPKHAHVALAQGLLTASSPVSPGIADGVAGSKFTSSVKAYQEVYGLVPDGICGLSTWEVLEGAVD